MKMFRNVVCSLTAMTLVVGFFAVTRSSDAVPPTTLSPKADRIAADAENISTIRSPGIQGPATVVENTGFEATVADGAWDAAVTGGFNGFVCGPEFSACANPADEVCTGLSTDNCCIDFPNPDNSWYMSTFSRHCAEPHIDTINPATGSQHLRFKADTSICVGGIAVSECRQTVFGPTVGGPLTIGPTTLSVDISSTGMGSSSFWAWWVADGGAGSSVVRVLFNYFGGMYMVDFAEGVYRFGGYWSTGPYKNLTIKLDPCNNVVEYSYGGQLVLTHALGSVARPWVSRTIMLTDNAGETWDVDNYSVIRGEACPTTCGADGIEGGEDCEHQLVCFGGANNGQPCIDDLDCPTGSCLAGDTNCPGRCGAIGTERECLCTRSCPNECEACDLVNGTNEEITSGFWFTWIADTPAMALDTCNTTNPDSRISVWTTAGSDDCLDIGLIALQDDCGSDAFGAGSDPLAPCFDAEGPGLGPGFPWNSCVCIPTTIGQRYWVWNDTLAGGLGTTINLEATKRLDCGMIWENGACCQPYLGTCTDEAAAASCIGPDDVFLLNKLCSISCETITGACCDRLDGRCSVTLRDDCTGSDQTVWIEGENCTSIVCDPARGACCNTRTGTCTDNLILADCPQTGTNLNWVKGDSCNELSCPDPLIPTVSQWGLVIMTLLLLIGAKVYFGRRQVVA